MVQAAAMFGGKLDADEEGLPIDSNGAMPPAHITRTHKRRWERKGCCDRSSGHHDSAHPQANRPCARPVPKCREEKMTARPSRHQWCKLYFHDGRTNEKQRRQRSHSKCPNPERSQRWNGLQNIAKAPIRNQSIRPVIAGSLGAHDKLHKACIRGSGSCLHCDDEDAPVNHIADRCPKLQYNKSCRQI